MVFNLCFCEKSALKLKSFKLYFPQRDSSDRVGSEDTGGGRGPLGGFLPQKHAPSHQPIGRFFDERVSYVLHQGRGNEVCNSNIFII